MSGTIHHTGAYREEDKERALVFVDMLGFAALVRRYPTRILDIGPDEKGWMQSQTTEMQTRVNRFQSVLDAMISEQALSGGVSAQVFSDCAYVDVCNPVRAARVAADLMRDFIKAEVPVRMGIGRGTYYPFKYAVENTGADTVTKALFAGTAVINAYQAERCGGKGLRILVDGDIEENLRTSGETLIPLPEALNRVRSELLYLLPDAHVHENDPRCGRLRVVDQDLRYIWHIHRIQASSGPISDDLRIHYTETFAAVGRMRLHLRGRQSWKRPNGLRTRLTTRLMQLATKGIDRVLVIVLAYTR